MDKPNIKLEIQIPAGVDVFIETVAKPFDPPDKIPPLKEIEDECQPPRYAKVLRWNAAGCAGPPPINGGCP